LPQKKVSEISYLKGVGPKRAEAFEKLGLLKITDLFNVYPRDYLVNTKIIRLRSFLDKNVLICGEITEKALPKKPKHPTRLLIKDDTGYIQCLVWGNFFYRDRQFKIGDKYLFWGKVAFNQYEGGVQFDLRDHKKYEFGDDEMMKYPFIPLYILSGELKKTWVKPLTLTKIIFNALKKSSSSISELLSDEIRTSNKLLEHKTAVLRTHYPLNRDDIENARQTLAFEELFFLQIVMALRKKSIEVEESGIAFEKTGERLERLFHELLGFELTNAQKRVIKEIRADMKLPKPMNRLLQGDVGSGKTIVAIFAMLIAIENGYQCAFMCPTEILAEQHYKVLKSYCDPLNVNVAQLVGGQKKKMREQILQDIRLGNANIIVGTHALIQEAVEYKKLGFIVIDEQHKFGVMQRAKLREKSSANGFNPDVLVMTATPIPRTLSLTIYGDLDVSVIDELPKNRKQIKTVLRTERERDKVYYFIRNEIKKGRQAYIVYPIIDESEKLDLKSAVAHYEILKNETFSDLQVGLIHGRLLWYEIDDTIEDFKNKKLDIIVTTTVIEVGIDIPNATIMLIEEAQRFGLSQLHQLRGRVGRGSQQSYCILMSDKLDENSKLRLETIVETTDGFKISDVDMKLRGPGEFFGTRQSGELKFSAADLSKDSQLVERSREAAFKLIEMDPNLLSVENKQIREHFLENYRDSMNLIKVA
jgi:ATP-dependent DNA helicase RecG